MHTQNLILGRRKFVVVAAKDFRALQKQAEEIIEQDEGDIAEARRRKAQGQSRPYAELREKLGLA